MYVSLAHIEKREREKATEPQLFRLVHILSVEPQQIFAPIFSFRGVLSLSLSFVNFLGHITHGLKQTYHCP